jgi:hypothetical protein
LYTALLLLTALPESIFTLKKSIEDFSGAVIQYDGKFYDDFVIVGFEDFDEIGIEAKCF